MDMEKDLMREALAAVERERRPLGRMRMRPATTAALWGLRLYVIGMMGLIGAKFLHLAAFLS